MICSTSELYDDTPSMQPSPSPPEQERLALLRAAEAVGRQMGRTDQVRPLAMKLALVPA